MLKLELFNPKTKRKEVFEKDYISTRYVRKALEIQIMAADPVTKQTDWFDALLDYTVSIFSDAEPEGVTEDMILDGIPSNKAISTLVGILQGVLGMDGKENASAKK